MTRTDTNAARPDPVPYVVGILAGGQSRRMGRSKAILTLPDGLTLIEHVATVAARLQPPPEDIVILGQFGRLPPSLANVHVLPDDTPQAGPLAGLRSLLDHAGDRWALLLACDMPFINTSALTKLLAKANPDIDAVAFVRTDRPGHHHPCCALYHPRLQPAVEKELTGERRLQHVLDTGRTAALQPSPDERRQLTNINTPEDYAQLSNRI